MLKVEYFLKSRFLTKPVNVLLVGAGGTGSNVLMMLAQLHHTMISLGHPYGLNVSVMDGDTVSATNVGRQAFFPSDVGLYKAEVLVNRVNLAFGLHWSAQAEYLEEEYSANMDIIIGCVDTRKARKIISEPSYAHTVLWLDFGNLKNSGQAIIGEICFDQKEKKLPNVADLFPEIVDFAADQDDSEPSCSLAESLARQSLFINRAVAIHGMQMLSDLFRNGKITYHGVFVNLQSGCTVPLAVDPKTWARYGYLTAEIANCQ